MAHRGVCVCSFDVAMPYMESSVIPNPAMPEARTFRAFVAEHQRLVYYLAVDLTGRHEDAEDLVQEVFIKAHNHLSTFRGEASIRTWLHRITVNTYLNSRRRQSMRHTQPASPEELDHLHPNPQAATDAQARQRLLNEHVNRAMARLSERERTAFVLRHYHEYKLAEVADAMGIALGSVKSLIFRALQKLRHELTYLRDEREHL